MTRKELFLNDLCARVPYHPKGHVVNTCNGTECDEWLTCATFTMFASATNNCCLYLRPMSSMTEEEDTRKCAFLDDIEGGIEDAIPNYIDYLNAHYFDYHGLIDRGLALEAPEGMYNLK